MSQPYPELVSPSTTFVQVDALQNPYTPVVLNAVQYTGQVVSVLNTLSSLQILTDPIVVSTTQQNFFPNSTFSTLIQQPQGFLTVQSQTPTQWFFLNSYPFRDQYISAGVQILTTSTLYTDILSTVQDRTSSLTVENLMVSGNFFQSSGLVLNTNVSSLGAVDLLSSLTVLGPTYFSTAVSSFGSVVFGSTLSVGKDFVSQSSLRFLSTFSISTSLSIQGSLSTPLIQLQGGLTGPLLEVQTSTPAAALLSGSLDAKGAFQFLSSVYVGGSATGSELVISGLVSSLSTMFVADRIFVSGHTDLQGDASISGKLRVGASLTVRESTEIVSTLSVQSNAFVRHDLYSLSTVSSQTLDVFKGVVFGNLDVVASSIVSTQRLVMNGNLGFGNLTAVSTSVGGTVSTTTNVVQLGPAEIQGSFTVKGSLSTLDTLSVDENMSILGHLNISRTLALTHELTIGKSLNVQGTSVWTTSPPFSTFVKENLEVLGSLRVSDTAFLSSIKLPLDVLAFNFEVSSMNAGHQGIASSVQMSSLYTSTLATGDLMYPSTTMDMQTALVSLHLSTNLLSTIQLTTYSNALPSTSFHMTSSLGIAVPAVPGRVDVGSLGYTQGPTYVGQILSSLTIAATPMIGTFVGDGSQLVNVNYPENVSTQFLSTGQLLVEKTFISSLVASSGRVLDVFELNSSIRVGDFYIYGNALTVPISQSNVLTAPSSDPSVLVLNNLYCYGDTAGVVPKQVIVNKSNLPVLDSNYVFGVGGTFRVYELSSPTYILELDTFRGDVVVARDIGSYDKNTIYVSSGVLGKGNGAFFIPEGYVPSILSTNIIQPVGSTLAFNSTLFVSQESQKVGINTQPTFTLDVHSNALIYDQVIGSISAIVSDKTFVQQSTNQIWLGTTGYSLITRDIQVSYDQGMTWVPFPPSNPNAGQPVFTIGYDGGHLTLTSSNTLRSYKQWIAGGNGFLMAHFEGSGLWINGFKADPGLFPFEVLSVANNGLLWVATGKNPSFAPSISYPTLLWSSNGLAWSNASSGGFEPDFVSDTYGGQGLVWNGSQWLALGRGSNAKNSILNSRDGKSWETSYTASFTNGANGAVWTGTHWVAVGNNGGPLSSFMISSDGSNWTGIGGYGFDSLFGLEYQRGYGIATNGSLLVAVGSSNPVGSAATIQYSEDGGYTWSNASGDLLEDTGRTIVWNGSYWIAGGRIGIRVSSDGKLWSQPSSPPSFDFESLAYGSNALPILQFGESNSISTTASTITTMNVACGKDTMGDLNCLRYSENGSNWNYALSGYFTDEARGAAYNGSNLWIAAGKGTMSNFIYSGDGRSWSNTFILAPISLTAVGTSVLFGTSFGTPYWVAGVDTLGGGGDTIYYSVDGLTWQSAFAFTESCQGVAFDGTSTWVAVGRGTGTIYYAPFAPSVWFASPVGSFDSSGNGIAYGNGLWVAVGADTGGNTILYSSDAQTWNVGTNIFGGEGFGVDYNGSNAWVAVGFGGGSSSNILFSTDGQTWANSTSGEFQTKGYGVRFNRGLQLWIATGYDTPGVGTIKYSVNGLDWLDGTSGFDTVGYGIGVGSNVFIFEDIQINQLRIYDTPGPSVSTRSTTPNLFFTSTQMTLMNTLTIDAKKNIGLQLISTTGVSTFVSPSLVLSRKEVSTQTIQASGFFLSLASV